MKAILFLSFAFNYVVYQGGYKRKEEERYNPSPGIIESEGPK